MKGVFLSTRVVHVELCFLWCSTSLDISKVTKGLDDIVFSYRIIEKVITMNVEAVSGIILTSNTIGELYMVRGKDWKNGSWWWKCGICIDFCTWNKKEEEVGNTKYRMLNRIKFEFIYYFGAWIMKKLCYI